MQSIVADTTPLNYLVLIQATEILPNLYRRVLIPPAVKAELAHTNAPDIVRAWISQPPSWLEAVPLKLPVDSTLSHLDAGEGEAISLGTRRGKYGPPPWITGDRHTRRLGPCCPSRTD